MDTKDQKECHKSNWRNHHASSTNQHTLTPTTNTINTNSPLSPAALDALHHVLLHLRQRGGVRAFLMPLAGDPGVQQTLASTQALSGIDAQHTGQQLLGLRAHLAERRSAIMTGRWIKLRK